MKFSVWAPAAQSVELVVGEPGGAGDAGDAGDAQRISMRRDDRGWWRTEVDDPRVRRALVDDGYRYAVDGAGPFPDPRSRWQAEGVHGVSRVPEPLPRATARFAAGPLSQAVVYELHIGTFTPAGTYEAALERLPHLKSLGITHIELMPLATFPGNRGWGYDGVDLYAPLPAYGAPEDLTRFIDECHAQGLAVLLDVVYNHLGPDGNYLGCYGPYFTDRVKTPWGEAINYDGAQSDEVRGFVIDNALMWLRDYGFDGLRLDAVHAIFSFEAKHVLEDLATAVRQLGQQLGRRLVLIAESDQNDPRLVHPVSRGGYGLDAHWSDDFHHAVHRFFTGESNGYYADFHGLPDVAAALRDGYVYQGQYSPFRQRRHGRAPQGVGADQLVVCAQNHDQIGNRARGERLSMLVEMPQLKAIAALTMLSPFVPMLFQGEEWGARTPFLYFTDHQDPALAKAVSEGRAREFESFGWAGEVPDPQSKDSFEGSKLDWSETERAPHAEILDWHRQLIALRASRAPTVGRAKPRVRFDEKARWLRFELGDLLAAFNFGHASRRIPLPSGVFEPVLDSLLGQPAAGSLASASVSIPAHGTSIYRRR